MNLSKTAEAVREYDKATAHFLSLIGTDVSHSNHSKVVEASKASTDDALENVKNAFADDTADRNSRTNARLVTPNGSNGWLRKILFKEGYTDCAPTPEVRQSLGWGW